MTKPKWEKCGIYFCPTVHCWKITLLPRVMEATGEFWKTVLLKGPKPSASMITGRWDNGSNRSVSHGASSTVRKRVTGKQFEGHPGGRDQDRLQHIWASAGGAEKPPEKQHA